MVFQFTNWIQQRSSFFRCVEGMGYVFTLKILFLADSLNVPLPKHLLKSDLVKLKYINNENRF